MLISLSWVLNGYNQGHYFHSFLCRSSAVPFNHFDILIIIKLYLFIFFLLWKAAICSLKVTQTFRMFKLWNIIIFYQKEKQIFLYKDKYGFFVSDRTEFAHIASNLTFISFSAVCIVELSSYFFLIFFFWNLHF